MPLLDTLSKLATAKGRACLTLLRADRFTIGRIGPGAQISSAQRALELLIREHATDMLFPLVQRASLAGQLYALLGLSLSHDPRVTGLLIEYRERSDEVRTQTGCFGGSLPVRDVIARIEDGTYSGRLESITNAASYEGSSGKV
jgi:hypothetical protein